MKSEEKPVSGERIRGERERENSNSACTSEGRHVTGLEAIYRYN